MMIATTTGSSLETYVRWLVAKAQEKADGGGYGELGLNITFTRGQLTDARCIDIDHSHFPLERQR